MLRPSHRAIFIVASLVLLATVSGACRATPTPHPLVSLRLGASDSTVLLARDLVDAYHNAVPYATVQVGQANTSSILREFSAREYDVALISRSPRADELAHPPARAEEIGRDGIVIVVHSANALTNISRDQLVMIFSGDIINWSQLHIQAPGGGPDAIQVISREDGSATRSAFEELAMARKQVTLTALIEPSNLDVINYVAANPNAIGYAAFNIWVANPRARALAIDNITPSLNTIKTSIYPFIRPFYLIIPSPPSPAVSNLVDFLLSPVARKIASNRIAAQ